MDLQEQHQPQVVKQAAKVQARTRPWHAYIALALAIIAAGVSYWFGKGLTKGLFKSGHLGDSVVAAVAAAAALGRSGVAAGSQVFHAGVLPSLRNVCWILAV